MERDENIVCLISYKENKLKSSIYTLYLEKLIEGIKAIQEMEKILYDAENDYGSKILKDIWNSLPQNEQMELEYCFDALLRKIRNCKSRTIPPSSYKPSS